MRILVDQDGVLAEWDGEFDPALDRYGEAAANIPRSYQREVFDLYHGLTSDEVKIVNEICDEPGYYDRLAVVPGAVEALNRMVAWGHEVHIVTTPWANNPTCASDKLKWMDRHFGREWANRVVITRDKTIVRGDYLIDDKWAIKGAEFPTWKHVVFGNRYNSHSEAEFRLDDWEHLELQPWWKHA